jgi:hypothetical protein
MRFDAPNVFFGHLQQATPNVNAAAGLKPRW